MTDVEVQIELDENRRQEVDTYFACIAAWDHYSALDVPRDATKDEIRQAYFNLSKRFHPDTLFGKELGPYKAKMEAVFQRVTDAYEVLGRRKRRQEYDAYLEARSAAEPVDTLPVEEAPGQNGAAAKRRRQLRKHHARRISLTLGRGMPGPGAVEADEPTFEGSDDALHHLGKALKKASKVTGGQVNREDRYFQEAVQAEQAGETVRAVNLLRLATGLAPDRGDIVGLYERLRKEVSGSMTQNFLRQAQYEEDHQMWEDAALSWSRVVEGRPDDANANRHAARCLASLGGSFRQARQYAQKALDLDPDKADSHVVMAQVFLSAGMRRNARIALEEAIQLNPDDQEVKDLLSGLDE